MRLALKYCGGCNPRYDRSAVKNEVRSHQDLEIVESPPDGNYDLVLVVCGCPVRCASHRGLSGQHGKLVISSPEELVIFQRFVIDHQKQS